MCCLQPYSKLASWAPQALDKISVAFKNVPFLAVDTTLPRVSTLLEYEWPPGVSMRYNGDFTANMWFDRGTRWHSLLRHCGTKRKVAGSISDRTVALMPTQPLTDMNTMNIPGVKATDADGRQSYNLHVETALKSGTLHVLELLRPVQSCLWTALLSWLLSVAFF
jgi:hypothetical protein